MLKLLLLYQFCLAKIYIYHKPRPTRDETCDLQIALPRTLILLFIFYTSGTPHARHIALVLTFEVGHFACHFLLLSFFLPLDIAMKGIHSTQLHCHISFLLFIQLTTCFLSRRGQLLDSHKCRLFCLHIQYATHCLFEWWTPVSLSEATVCGFCLSISLHLDTGDPCLLEDFIIRDILSSGCWGWLVNHKGWWQLSRLPSS